MKRGFFSFLTVTLVALVLFMAAAYVFTFKDFRMTAEKDLELRKAAERLEDTRNALNRTVIDAIFDSAYYSYGCTAVTDNNASGFCGSLSNYLDWYAANLSTGFSDAILSVNVTRLSSDCATNDTPSLQFLDPAYFPSGTAFPPFVNATKNFTAAFSMRIESQNAKMQSTQNYVVRIDLVRTQRLVGAAPGVPTGSPIFAVRTRGLSVNGSSEYIYVTC